MEWVLFQLKFYFLLKKGQVMKMKDKKKKYKI